MNPSWSRPRLLLALTAVTSVAANPIDLLVGKPEVDVITFTELTPAGRGLAPPSPQKPVYYVAATSGFKDLGGQVAGEKPPPNEKAIRTISKALASQGYLPASASGPAPSLLLVFTWGTLNVDELDPVQTESSDSSSAQINRARILRFVGVDNMKLFGRSAQEGTESFQSLGLSIADAEKFQELASQDLFIASVSAYDLESAKRKERKQLWITRVSCPSKDFSLQGIMPTILTLAAPHFGRETKPPTWVKTSEKYKPSVRIHDLELLEYLDKGPLPVLDLGKTAPEEK